MRLASMSESLSSRTHLRNFFDPSHQAVAFPIVEAHKVIAAQGDEGATEQLLGTERRAEGAGRLEVLVHGHARGGLQVTAREGWDQVRLLRFSTRHTQRMAQRMARRMVRTSRTA